LLQLVEEIEYLTSPVIQEPSILAIHLVILNFV